MKTLLKILIILSPLSLWRGAGGEVQAQSWQWASRMGSISTAINNDDPDETVKDMATDAQGNVYACGRILAGADFNGTNVTTYGGYDLFLAKYDCHGNLLWVRIAGSPQYGDEAYALALDGLGHIYLTGKVFSDFVSHLTFIDSVFTEIVQDLFIAKFDTSGNFLWVKVAYPGPGSSMLGSFGLKMEIDSHGFINILTSVTIDGLFFPGDTVERGFYIARFDTSGMVNRMIQIINVDFVGGLNDFKISSTGDYYLTGLFYSDSMIIANHTFNRISTPPFSDLYLIKLDSNGTYQWDVHLGKPGNAGIAGYGISLNTIDEVYFTGGIGDGMTLGTDTFFNPLLAGPGNPCPFVAKFDSQGKPLWAVNIQNQYAGRASAGIQVKSNNNAVFAGFFGGNCIIGPDSFSSNGTRDIFIAEVNASGVILQGAKIDGSGDGEYPECITRDANDNIFIGGGFDGTLNVNGTLVSAQGGNTDGFIAKWGTICTTGIQENEPVSQNGIIAYPNPATDILHIKTKELKGSISISLYNTLGQKTFEQQFKETNGNDYTINVKQLPIGIYYVVVTDQEKRLSTKVLKEE